MNDITVVLTSCGRADLLEQTIDSFLATNTYPVARFLVVEDSTDPACAQLLRGKYAGRVEARFNPERLGQIESIDRAYATVDTEWIFHCEDDWQFYRAGYVEESLEILQERPDIFQVWLRELWDTNGHPPERSIHTSAGGTQYRYMTTGYHFWQKVWHGFSFNPGLRRTADYRMLGRYGMVGHEAEIGEFYFQRGFRAAILERGAVEHLGGTRHIVDVGERRPEAGVRDVARRVVRAVTPPVVLNLGKRLLK